MSTDRLNSETKKRLYGRKSTNRDWIDEILRLRLGDARRNIAPLNNSIISTKLGVSRYWVIELIKLAIQNGLIEQDPTNPSKLKKAETKPELEFHAFDDESFMKDNYVADWVYDLQHKGEGGKPKKTWRKDYKNFQRVCNFMKLKPETWVNISRDEFKQRMSNLKDEIIARPEDFRLKPNAKIDGVWHALKMTCRLFCSYYGTSLPKGIGGILSGKVISHGLYKDLRLSDAEIAKGADFIIGKWGLDSDIFRVYSVGIESGARAVALIGMKCDWNEFKHGNDVWFEMKAYETKTESSWTKYIYGSRTQESLKLHREKGFKTLISVDSTHCRVSLPIAEQLRIVYRFLGKEFSNDGYYMKKPFHTLRHIATQCWIRKANGNLTMVRKACGWTSDLELEASYGELPPEIVIGMLPTTTGLTA